VYELTIDWPPMAENEAAELVKPAAAALSRHGFTAGECFLEMILQDIGEPFDGARSSAWIEAERALPAVGGRNLLLGITPQDIRRRERGTERAREWGSCAAQCCRRYQL
jgi:hypothetical protein